MPTDNTSVGPLVLPVPSGGANSALEDRTLLGLLDYLAFWLRESLTVKVGEQEGPIDGDPLADPCPSANLFPWNHDGTFVRPGRGSEPLPGLWAWEESNEPTTEYSTLLYDVIRREIRVQYIFPELLKPTGVAARHGLIPAVGRIFAKAAERGRHSEYGFDGDDANTPIWNSCDWRGFQYRGGRALAVGVTPSPGQAQDNRRAQGAIKRFYPSFLATFWIWERVGLQEPDVDEALDVGDFTIDVADSNIDDGDPLPDVMVRELPGAED